MDDAADRTYKRRENAWDDQEPSSNDNVEHPTSEPDVDNEETPFPDVVGTTDPLVATRDAEPYSAPTDPPVLPGGREGIHVATGFGQSPEEEAARAGEPRGDEELRVQARRVLANDSLTSTLDLHLHVRDGVIYLHGPVPSIDDAEYAQSVLGDLPGVVDVVDDTTFDPAANG